jgi:ATP-dependent Clp protease ATP-binding subunit ClpA
MFERYTESARRAIFFARAEALARQASEIGTQDILLGLTYRHYEEASPFAMLHARRDELRTLMGAQPMGKMPEAKNIPLARDSKISLAYAAQEVNADKQFSLEPHHLLRGIVRTGDSTALALMGLGWNLEALRTLSLENRRLFPPKRPSIKRVLRLYVWRLTPYQRLAMFAVVAAIFAAILCYLRWQQR